jgi:hypothetical protein
MNSCEFCEKNLPTQRCFTCQLSYCDLCSSTIHSKGALKNHDRRILDDQLAKVLKIGNHFQKFYQNKKFSDLTLLCGGEKFFVHRIVLSTFSEIFEKIFSNGMKESQENEIILEDLKPNILEILLKFIYFHDKIELNQSNAMDVFFASSFYGIEELKEISEQSLISYLDLDNIFDLFPISISLNSTKLQEKCLDLFGKNFKTLSTSPQFVLLDFEILKSILTLNLLNESEGFILNATILWYNSNSTQKNAFKIFNFIDFLRLNEKQIKSFNEEFKTKIQNSDEILPIIKSPIVCRESDSALTIMKYSTSLENGIYNIKVKGKVFPIYCDMNFEGGGWMLVRRQKPNIKWTSPNDNLAGKKPFGSIDFRNASPTINESFGLEFDSLPFTHFLFITGDQSKWLICHRDSVYKNWTGVVKSNIEKSYISKIPYSSTWCKRMGVQEDPWISARDHGYNGIGGYSDNDSHSMLYGEVWQGWNYNLINHNGCNVFIK